MLTTLLMGNRDLLEHSITPATIAKFVDLIRQNPENDRFLKLLCALCTCDGSPVPCNQEAITDVLVKDRSAARELLVAIRVGDSGSLEVRGLCAVSAAVVVAVVVGMEVLVGGEGPWLRSLPVIGVGRGGGGGSGCRCRGLLIVTA
jgi:hypothetical protein